MKNTTVHIIEPTLAGQTGHCYGYVQSLLRVSPEHMQLWINKHGVNLFKDSPAICHGYFSRKLRKIQQFFLYRRLLKTSDTLFVPTAGRIDMVMLDKLLSKRPSQARVVLHFHQFSRSAKKLALLKQFAQRHPEWTILSTTDQLVALFKDAGFKHVYAVPCPGYTPQAQAATAPFRYVLYAGAARADKGFAEAINAVALDQQSQTPTPFRVQISPPESGRYDELCQKALHQLRAVRHADLQLVNHTLDKDEYLEQFAGSICLLAYDPGSYHDKFSAVTLDAICCGAPIITITNTWMADTVNQYQVGLVINDRQPETILNAIATIKNNYTHFQQNCLQASRSLIAAHDPKHTVAYLLDAK